MADYCKKKSNLQKDFYLEENKWFLKYQYDENQDEGIMPENYTFIGENCIIPQIKEEAVVSDMADIDRSRN